MGARVRGEVTQWSLELTDPAALRPPARVLTRNLKVVQARDPGTSERMYRRVGADWQWTDRLGWSPARWTAWEGTVETWLAFADGELAGYVELDPSRSGSCEIAYFGLLPSFHGLGLGGHLLAAGIRRAFAHAPRVWARTCSLDGPHALANYEARGMAIFKVTSSVETRVGSLRPRGSSSS